MNYVGDCDGDWDGSTRSQFTWTNGRIQDQLVTTVVGTTKIIIYAKIFKIPIETFHAFSEMIRSNDK